MQAADTSKNQNNKPLPRDVLPSGIKTRPTGEEVNYKRYFPLVGHRLFIASGIIIAVIVILLSVTLATSRTSWFGRAQTPTTSTALSRENSYIFASPITAAADGTSIIRITVFILNNQGLGVGGLSVELKTSGPVQIAKTQAVTDTLGRAIFDVTSTSRADYTIRAEVSGVSLPQSVSVSFQ